MHYHILDVFTRTAFTGNPLAVVLGADGLSDEQMLTMTKEFNLSETIFVQTPENLVHTAKVRIFCPAVELPFAGHPTIGCAILLAEMANTGDFDVEITLEEVAGLVPVRVSRKGANISAEFVAPVIPFVADGTLPTDTETAVALGLSPADIGFENHVTGHWQGGPDFLYIPIASRAALSKAKPSGSWLEMTSKAKTQSVYLYCPDGRGYAARMFAPEHGMPEDPATGSASAILAAQLLAAGVLPDGKTTIPLKQGEDMGRPSEITLTVDVANQTLQQVRIMGSATRVYHGQISALPL